MCCNPTLCCNLPLFTWLFLACSSAERNPFKNLNQQDLLSNVLPQTYLCLHVQKFINKKKSQLSSLHDTSWLILHKVKLITKQHVRQFEAGPFPGPSHGSPLFVLPALGPQPRQASNNSCRPLQTSGVEGGDSQYKGAIDSKKKKGAWWNAQECLPGLQLNLTPEAWASFFCWLHLLRNGYKKAQQQQQKK